MKLTLIHHSSLIPHRAPPPHSALSLSTSPPSPLPAGAGDGRWPRSRRAGAATKGARGIRRPRVWIPRIRRPRPGSDGRRRGARDPTVELWDPACGDAGERWPWAGSGGQAAAFAAGGGGAGTDGLGGLWWARQARPFFYFFIRLTEAVIVQPLQKILYLLRR